MLKDHKSLVLLTGITFKGDSNPNDSMCIRKSSISFILIPVLSKSVKKWESCGRLNICKWTVMEAAIL